MESNGKKLSKDMLNVLATYEGTSQGVIKQNLKDSIALDSTKETYGNRKDIADYVGIEINSLQSCLNVSHASKLTFENLVRLCGSLNLDIYSMFVPTTITTHLRNSKVWTPEKKVSFINRFEIGGIESVKEEFNLSDKTILHYYNVFTRELEEIV